MSLFQTRLVLNGIADSRTLESISLALGEYDRELVSTSSGTTESGEWLTPPGHNESTSYQTHRQRTLIPGEIAQLPDGHGLLLRGASWGLVETHAMASARPVGQHRRRRPGRRSMTPRVRERSRAESGVRNLTGLVSVSILTCYGW